VKGLFRPVPKVPPHPSPTAPLVLVIDDDLEVRRLLRRHLEAAGYRVATAEDAVEAGHSVADQLPDLIIADFKMPYMNGNEFVGLLRGDETVPDIPVLFITSKQSSNELVGRTFGFPLLTKPLDVEDLLANVKALLARGIAAR
jgi:two-component system phosphate regulon response regulator PhoB